MKRVAAEKLTDLIRADADHFGKRLPREGGPVELTPLKQSVVSSYSTLVFASYDDALAGARALAGAIDRFVASPSDEGLRRARQAWIDARVPYAQTEAYRFYDGPIDAVEGLINSWPIDENLIDYVEGDATAGVINHPAAQKYQYWINAERNDQVEDWLSHAVEHKGAWWPYWEQWLKERANGEAPARTPGDGALTPLGDAPGEYVRVRSAD